MEEQPSSVEEGSQYFDTSQRLSVSNCSDGNCETLSQDPPGHQDCDSQLDNESEQFDPDNDTIKKSVSWAEDEVLVEIHEIERIKRRKWPARIKRFCCCCRKKQKRENY